MAEIFSGSLPVGLIVLLFLALAIACGFEFVNGFHDTANAVATVIYTKSLKPVPSVVWSGICNFCGVFLGGIAVAIGIVNLLPVELLVSSGAGAGMAMVLALLIAAVIWNVGTVFWHSRFKFAHADWCNSGRRVSQLNVARSCIW